MIWFFSGVSFETALFFPGICVETRFLESNDKAICDVWNSEVYFDPDTSLKEGRSRRGKF